MAKIIAKPRIRKGEAEKYLAKVPEEFVFWVNDGRVLRDLRELADGLVNMPDETFAYHCNDSKKDFANWVRDIVKDEFLAKELDKTLTRSQASKVVAERVASLSARVK